MEKCNKPIEALAHGLLKQLELKLYGQDTLNNYRRIIKKLALYMQWNEIPAYSSEIGDSLLRIIFPLVK